MYHKSTGTIIYDPNRFGMKKRTEWWSILEVDKEITRYYRWWVKNRYWIDLIKPSWDAHISIVRGEKPKPELMHLWKKYDKQKVDFLYEHKVYKGKKNEFWMVEVKSPFLLSIRKELCLPTNWSLHLTIGKTRQ